VRRRAISQPGLHPGESERRDGEGVPTACPPEHRPSRDSGARSSAARRGDQLPPEIAAGAPPKPVCGACAGMTKLGCWFTGCCAFLPGRGVDRSRRGCRRRGMTRGAGRRDHRENHRASGCADAGIEGDPSPQEQAQVSAEARGIEFARSHPAQRSRQNLRDRDLPATRSAGRHHEMACLRPLRKG